jgi:hypothetical protein
VDLQPRHSPKAGPVPAKRAPPARPRTKEPALLGLDDPAAFRMPTPEELDAEVRRRPAGRTIAYICMDLGITPFLCEGEFWYRVDKILQRYGGSLHRLYLIRNEREQTFQRERDRRPDTWHIEWRPGSKSAARQALGYLIGETPQIPSLPASCLPAIVPS